MKTKLMTLMIILMLMCSGCGNWMCENLGMFCPDNPSTKPEVNTVKDIEEAKKTVEKSSNIIEEASKEISTEANKITTEATKVQSKIPKEVKIIIDPHLNSIKESSTAILEETTIINKASAKLVGATSLLDSSVKKVVIIEKALDNMTNERDSALKERDEALDAKNSQLHKALQWLIISCIVGCGAFIVLFFFTGSKGGLMASGGCGLVLIIAIFVNKFITFLAIGGGVLLLLMAGILLYNIYIKNKAFKEIINTVEITKTGLTPNKKEEIFGKDGEIGIMNRIQSSSTINLIKKEKSKMLLWNSMKKKKE